MNALGKSTALCCFTSILICLVFPLAIAEIAIGAVNPGDCNMESDLIGFNVSPYLIVMGVTNIIAVIFYSCIAAVGIFNDSPIAPVLACGVLISIIGSILLLFFNLAWFIVGAIILFDGNIECIREGSTTIIFALVMWCLAAFHLVSDCCKIKINNKSNE